jgi:hypothetical protein
VAAPLNDEDEDEYEHDVEQEDDYGNPDESHSQKTLGPCAVALAVVAFDGYRKWLGTDSLERMIVREGKHGCSAELGHR